MSLTRRQSVNARVRGWGATAEEVAEKEGIVAPAPRVKRERSCPSEWKEQSALVTWWWRYAPTKGLDVRYLFSIPNGAHLAGDTKRRAIQTNFLKASGMRNGVPDLMLALPRGSYHGLFIELKALDGSANDNQREYHDLLMKSGYQVNVCFGCEAGMDTIRAYVEG